MYTIIWSFIILDVIILFDIVVYCGIILLFIVFSITMYCIVFYNILLHIYFCVLFMYSTNLHYTLYCTCTDMSLSSGTLILNSDLFPNHVQFSGSRLVALAVATVLLLAGISWLARTTSISELWPKKGGKNPGKPEQWQNDTKIFGNLEPLNSFKHIHIYIYRFSCLGWLMFVPWI